jgi:pimeloyl-[acyl-carrier protein] methyl ester esterase
MNKTLVFLHGWGQSRQVWHQQMQAFPDALFLNLPGHGGSAESGEWLAAMADQLPESPAIIVGWSLGGIIAMQLALHYPQKVAGLALVSTTPCFCQRDGWPHGADDELFSAFEEGVKSNSAKTMSRFFALMLHGDEISRSDYNRIAREAIDKGSEITPKTLQKGLEHLAHTDLRSQLTAIQQPALILHGNEDAIVPVAAGTFLAEHLPHAESHLFDTCGHAPFLTQSRAFNDILEPWSRTL